MEHPLTPDGRYMVIRGRLWRVANPNLSTHKREALVNELMDARRQVKSAMSADDAGALAVARRRVNDAKIALGERGPVWWTDGTKDFNRYLVQNTPYRDWFEQLAGLPKP